jgi:hypothetical protein
MDWFLLAVCEVGCGGLLVDFLHQTFPIHSRYLIEEMACLRDGECHGISTYSWFVLGLRNAGIMPLCSFLFFIGDRISYGLLGLFGCTVGKFRNNFFWRLPALCWMHTTTIFTSYPTFLRMHTTIFTHGSWLSTFHELFLDRCEPRVVLESRILNRLDQFSGNPGVGFTEYYLAVSGDLHSSSLEPKASPSVWKQAYNGRNCPAAAPLWSVFVEG